MNEGFIKLYKKMLKWEWYDDANTKILFLHCLLKANWERTKWHGIELEPGQFITSLPKLAKDLDLSVHQVRTALEHLKSTGEVADIGQSKYRIITVNSWCEYQGDGRQTADKWQTSGRQVAAVKETKNKRNKDIDINIQSFSSFWEHYPKKVEKANAYKCYKARLNDGFTEEELMTACINYAEECKREKREKRYIKNGSTFLSVTTPFVDYLKGESNDPGVGKPSQRDEEQREAEIRRYIESDEFKNAGDEDLF